jgi:diguanylate cyclase (GGDEF)-like protein
MRYIYQKLSEDKNISKDLRKMWKGMAEDEKEHLTYWNYLKERQYRLKVLLPGTKQSADDLLAKLIDEAKKYRAQVDRNNYTEQDMLEFTINTEFSALISPMQRIMYTHDIIFDKKVFNPQTMYEGHLDKFTEVGLKKFKEDRVRFILLNSIKLLLKDKRRLVSSSVKDSLTGLKNRRYFFQNASFLMEVAQREKNPVAIVIADIDKFKDINDRYGHLAGDKVLTKVAEVFRKNTRSADIAARYGGDEFIFMLFDQNKEQVGGFINRLHSAIKDLNIKTGAGDTIVPDISIGYSITDPSKDGKKLNRLIKEADREMYKNKSGSDIS